MNYNVVYRQNADLPKLAWSAKINKTTKEITVDCGSCVECFDDFFVAGAWDGDFSAAGFDTSEIFCGTGCRIEQNELVFCTPSHALERLVYAQTEETVTVSNSLPFLLSQTGCQLSKSISQYERLFCSVLDGPQKMVTAIPLADGKQIHQAIVSLIHISADGKIRVENRKKQEPFLNFDHYRQRLSDALKKLRSNSLSPDRRYTKFGIVSTMSSGYDSPTCSALAQEVGCNTVVSLTGGKYDKDDGYEIAVQLGFENIIRRNMYEYRKRKGNLDAEFLAGGELGTALQFSVFDDVFEDSLVIFGLRGSYWDKTASMTEEFEMIGYFNCESDASITENALKHGYLVVPVPTFGASVCNSIFAITNSEEMQAWSVGGSYDKPIPRRILESKGVSRQSFGQVKYGGGFSFSRDNKVRLKSRMTEEGYRSFLQFVSDGKGAKWNISRVASLLKYIMLNLPAYGNFVCAKLKWKIHFKQKAYRLANARIVADLLFWGTDVMTERYAEAMKTD